jgi:hypothetical protein
MGVFSGDAPAAPSSLVGGGTATADVTTAAAGLPFSDVSLGRSVRASGVLSEWDAGVSTPAAGSAFRESSMTASASP